MLTKYHFIIALTTVTICVTSCQDAVSPNHSIGGECYSAQAVVKSCETELSTIDASLIGVNSDGCVDVTSIASHPCMANLR